LKPLDGIRIVIWASNTTHSPGSSKQTLHSRSILSTGESFSESFHIKQSEQPELDNKVKIQVFFASQMEKLVVKHENKDSRPRQAHNYSRNTGER